MKSIFFNALLISFIILGCGNSTTSNEQTKALNSDEKSCLEQYVDTPCDILSADKIIALAGFETSEIEFKEPISMKVAGGFQCVYLWNSEKTRIENLGDRALVDTHKKNDHRNCDRYG